MDKSKQIKIYQLISIGLLFCLFISILEIKRYRDKQKDEIQTILSNESCIYGCDVTYDEINFRNYLDRIKAKELLFQCKSDCNARYHIPGDE